MHSIRSIFYAVFFLCLSGPAGAQIKFVAEIHPEKIGVNDYATLRFTVHGSTDIQHIYPPDLKDVQLVAGPESKAEEMNFNGQVSRTFSVAFVIKPLKAGRIMFEPARVKVSGKEYLSNEVSLNVVKATNGAKPETGKGRGPNDDDEILSEGEDINKKVNDNMVLRLETDKKQVYVGEPVVAEFKLYSRLKSNSRLTKNPSFNGFSVIDLQPPDVTGSGTGTLNGKAFNVYTVRKVLLYPLQAGRFTIEELELENHVQFIVPGPPADPYDIFSLLNPGYQRTVSNLVTLSSAPVDIMVKPLPVKDKPSNFSGAVGKYHITARALSSDFRADEEGRLVVEISGRGNLQLVNAPEVNWPAGMEAFDPSVVDTMNTKELPVTGKKTFEYVLSVARPGKYIIPPVSFSYFDSDANRYITSESDPVMLNVSPSKAAIKNVAALPVKSSRGANGLLWVLFPAAGIAAVILFFVFRNLRREHKQVEEDVVNEKSDFPMKVMNVSPLEKSAQFCAAGDSKNFYPALNHEFKSWLMERFCLEPNEASLDHLRECMDEAGVPNKTMLEVQQLLREIEWRLYAPAELASGMHEHFTRANMLVKDLGGSVRDV